MTEMFIRPLFDNRMLRATGAMDLQVPLTTAMGQTFQTMGRVLLQGIEAGAIFNEGEADTAVEDWRQAGAVQRLTESLDWVTDKGERDDVLGEIRRISDASPGVVTTATRAAIDAGTMLSPEALNEDYADLGLSFDYPLTREQARAAADAKRAEVVRQAILGHAPAGLGPSAALLGANLVVMATDPLEVASMFIPVVGAGGKAWAVARLGRVGGRVAAGAVEAGVGQALTEPVYYALNQRLQLDYDMADSLLNVGLGFAFGAGVGAIGGMLARADVPAPTGAAARDRISYIDPTLERDIGQVAFRQFVTDQPVNITRFLDGRDLRGSTSLSRVTGIVFQAPAPISRAPTTAARSSYLAAEASGAPQRFDTVQKADTFAARVGGEVLRDGADYVVRVPLEGAFLRSPRGTPLTFPTERAAAKFIDAAATIAPDARVVQLPGSRRSEFGIAVGMPDAELRAITATPGGLRLAPGVNTREIAVRPSANSEISQAVRGVIAHRSVAQEIARDALAGHIDPADVAASRAAAEAAGPRRAVVPKAGAEGADGHAAVRAEIAEFEHMIGQIEMSETQRADFEAAQALEEIGRARAEVAEAAAACLARVA